MSGQKEGRGATCLVAWQSPFFLTANVVASLLPLFSLVLLKRAFCMVSRRDCGPVVLGVELAGWIFAVKHLLGRTASWRVERDVWVNGHG